MKCQNCRFANKSGNPEYVYCTFWQSKANQYQASHEEFIKQIMFLFPSPSNVGLGWAYPHQPFQGEAHWIVKGTATEGVMWNGQICVHQNETCHEYKNALQTTND